VNHIIEGYADQGNNINLNKEQKYPTCVPPFFGGIFLEDGKSYFKPTIGDIYEP
jgi:hypothetical protein